MEYLLRMHKSRSFIRPAVEFLIIYNTHISYRSTVIQAGNAYASSRAPGADYLAVSDIHHDVVDGTVLGIEYQVSLLKLGT